MDRERPHIQRSGDAHLRDRYCCSGESGDICFRIPDLIPDEGRGDTAPAGDPAALSTYYKSASTCDVRRCLDRGNDGIMTHSTSPEPGDDRLNLENLISRLLDPEKAVRAEAMHGLVAIGKPAVPACIALLSDGGWRVRYRAAEALGLLGDGEAYEPLVAALDDEKDHVRYMAAKGLGLLGDPRAVMHLGAMRDDENEFVRRSAARSLGAIGGEEAVLALREVLEDETTDGVRATILEALRDAGVDTAVH